MLIVALVSHLLVTAAALPPEPVTIPWSRSAFSADEGCQWDTSGPDGLRLNDHYLAPPAAGQDWQVWLTDLRRYRERRLASLGSAAGDLIRLRFDGVRAWVRIAKLWACAADLQPGEMLSLTGRARWLEGNRRVCLAFDWCDRAGEPQGPWRGWSTVVASTEVPADGEWHPFRTEVVVPEFDRVARWARPILGMDGTFDPTRGAVELDSLRLELPRTEARAAALAAVAGPASFDDSVYRRPALAWMRRNFVCGFLMLCDRQVWDPGGARYRIDALCDGAQAAFGGYDSVVLWHAYPRIGADERNQFDFFRDLPGGLDGLRAAVEALHRRGVRVFIPYNPWDTGTRREGVPDDEALAGIVGAIGADGIFLDTMRESPARLRELVDAARPGVVFEPEGHPAVEEMQHCNGSWAQGLRPFPGIGVLHLKWLEPRHMQHQIRRWDTSHRDELAAAWLNGSGMLVWENIFGSWNPWRPDDRASLRRMAPVLRHCSDLLSEGEWLPCWPTLVPGVLAGCWQQDGLRLWTLVNETKQPVAAPVFEVDDRGEQFWDLWRGVLLEPERRGGRVRLTVPLDDFGGVLAVRAMTPELEALLAAQRREAGRPADTDPRPAESVVEAQPPPACPPPRPEATAKMLRIEPGGRSFTVRHLRRECGCYPDPGTPAEQWSRFLTGAGHTQAIEHHIEVELVGGWIGREVTTNGQYEAFLRATGYRPSQRHRFLSQWGGTTCPPALRDEPVVNVGLGDARAYAAWAGQRLPTEWEWQAAATDHGEAFRRGRVWEWTESERDDGHTRFVMLRGGSGYQAQGSIWYFAGGEQPLETHAKFLLMDPSLDRCSTIGFRCLSPGQ